jgi:glycosyltransferase involved in cell wall biosynthesis
VALVCPTVGQTRRGYERYIDDLMRIFRSNLDLTLFKGAGTAGEREKVVPHVTRTGLLSRLFPDRFLHARYLIEFGTFGASVAPLLARGQFDIVHFIDPPLARCLHAVRRLSGKRFRLLFTNARPEFYDCSRWADHIHCITPAAIEEAERTGVSSRRLSLIPPGIDSARVTASEERAELRRKYGVPQDQFVVLSVTTLNRQHKRVDYLIEESAALGGNPLLWIDGSLHPDGDPSLVDMATVKLGSRFRRTHVASQKVGELLKLADVFVSSALVESFGMAIVEAMFCGLPVVTHDSPHFRWLTNGVAHFVDMTKPGNLARFLSEAMRSPGLLRSGTELRAAARRFDWQEIGGDYLEMYSRALRD